MKLVRPAMQLMKSLFPVSSEPGNHFVPYFFLFRQTAMFWHFIYRQFMAVADTLSSPVPTAVVHRQIQESHSGYPPSRRTSSRPPPVNRLYGFAQRPLSRLWKLVREPVVLQIAVSQRPP